MMRSNLLYAPERHQQILDTARVRGRVEAVILVDLRGEPDSAVAGWSRTDRLRNAVTNLQETGRFVGVGLRRYAFAEPAEDATLAVEDGRFVARGAGGAVVLDPAREEPLEGSALVTFEPEPKALARGVAWIVDTVRNLSFVGPEPIAPGSSPGTSDIR